MDVEDSRVDKIMHIIPFYCKSYFNSFVNNMLKMIYICKVHGILYVFISVLFDPPSSQCPTVIDAFDLRGSN